MAKAEFKRVAVLMGGPSSERKVSLASGAAVAAALRSRGLDAVEVDVQDHKLKLPRGVDAAFIAMHGEFGEDGQAQELLERAGVPYTGSGREASRLAFDKRLSKNLFLREGVATAPFEWLKPGQARRMPLPVVVKPLRQGSTIGIHRVFEEKDWAEALQDAMTYDGEVIVEPYIDGRELTVGILGSAALPLIEIRAPGGWYDYAAKYEGGQTQYLVPAPLPEAETRRCLDLGQAAYAALGCRGFGRVDLRMNGQGQAFVLEVNTIPGFTRTSLVPKAAAAAGIEFPELCVRILQTAALT